MPAAAEGVDLDRELDFAVLRPDSAVTCWHSRATMFDDRLPGTSLPIGVGNFHSAAGLDDRHSRMGLVFGAELISF